MLTDKPLHARLEAVSASEETNALRVVFARPGTGRASRAVGVVVLGPAPVDGGWCDVGPSPVSAAPFGGPGLHGAGPGGA